MSLHVFANIVTPYGLAANNRGDNQGSNITPLQKVIWLGEPHTTVSAEAIRFAFRRRLRADGLPCNRHWAEHLSDIPAEVLEQLRKAYKGEVKTPCGYFIDPDFVWYRDRQATGYADDDLLGFMSAQAAEEETEAVGTKEPDEAVEVVLEGAEGKGKKKAKRQGQGTAYIRRAVLEVCRAVSLTPWDGNVTFNAASAGATPSAQKKGSNPVPYGTECHATRYQYGVALTPEELRDKSRATSAVKALCELGRVAGNHGRFKFDFSPDAVVFRLTDDPAPRLLYCFQTKDNGRTVLGDTLLKRVTAGDVKANELVLGVGDLESELAAQFKSAGVTVLGVRAACDRVCQVVNDRLGVRG